MSNNPNFYNNPRSNATFQHNVRAQFTVPPPPAPPLYFIPPIPSTEKLDQEFLKNFENKLLITKKSANTTPLAMSQVRSELFKVVDTLKQLKAKEVLLRATADTLSEEQWKQQLKEIEENKNLITKSLAEMKGPHFDNFRKNLVARSAKRLAMTKTQMETKKNKEEKLKAFREKVRKLDENLLKMKDDRIRTRQGADGELREVLRKKHNAKRSLVKIHSLLRLRKARVDTARGRGEIVSAAAAETFKNAIDKLLHIWSLKLNIYEIQEAELRTKMQENSVQPDSSTTVATAQREVVNNLKQWQGAMFGGETAQMDFEGDVGAFVAVRSQWDQHISGGGEGTALPVGWVPPSEKTTDN